MVEEGLSLEVTFTQRKQLMQRFEKEQNGMFCQLEDRKHKSMRERGGAGRGQISEGFLGKGEARGVWILSVKGNH